MGVEVEDDRLRVTRPWGSAQYSLGRLSRGWRSISADGSGFDRLELELWSLDAKDKLFVTITPGAERIVRLTGGEYHCRVWPRRRPGACDPTLCVVPASGLDVARAYLRRAPAISQLDARQLRAALGHLLSGGAAAVRGQDDPQPFLADIDDARELERRAAALPAGIKFQIAVDRTDQAASETIASLRAQPFERWEVVPPGRLTDGGAVRCALRAGDVLAPDTLIMVAETFVREPFLGMLYGDLLVNGAPMLKPQWDPELRRSVDFVSDVMFLAPVEQRAEGPRAGVKPQPKVEEGDARSIRLLPCPLVVRASTVAEPRPTAEASPRPRTAVKTSVIVPTRDGAFLPACLDGLLSRTTYPDLEIMVVDNGSRSPETLDLLRTHESAGAIRVLGRDAPFNFSQLCNDGVRETNGDIVVLLNDDVEPIAPDWLAQLVALAQRPDVGAVGPLLLYPDGRIQHAGVALGLLGLAGHPWRFASPERPDPQLRFTSRRSALTGACLAVRRTCYEEVQGLDENLPVTLNDVDFCLRLGARGYVNLYAPVRMIHHESQTRTPDCAPENVARRREEERRFRERWAVSLAEDPYLSPAVARHVETASPR